MTKFSEKKQAQGDPALRARIEKLERLVSALIADVEAIRQRIAKVEVVFSGKGDGRRPETD